MEQRNGENAHTLMRTHLGFTDIAAQRLIKRACKLIAIVHMKHAPVNVEIGPDAQIFNGKEPAGELFMRKDVRARQSKWGHAR